MDGIDASIGLNSTLQLLKQYRQNGVLQAGMLRVPNIRGSCTGYIRLVDGDVVSCYIQGKNGQEQVVDTHSLVRLDKEKGPFEWRFLPQQTQMAVTPSQAQPSQRPPSHAVPHAIARLNLDWLTTWSPQQKRALYLVYSMVDGRRTVEGIEMRVSLPRHIVEEALVILIAMRIIVMVTS